jgi:hypothetical protein
MAKKLPVGGHAARRGTSLNVSRGARGTDGDSGSDFSKKHAQDPWTVKAGDGINPRGAGKYTSDDAGLVQRSPAEDVGGEGEYSAGSRDVWDAVEGQSSDDGNRRVRSRDSD